MLKFYHIIQKRNIYKGVTLRVSMEKQKKTAGKTAIVANDKKNSIARSACELCGEFCSAETDSRNAAICSGCLEGQSTKDSDFLIAWKSHINSCERLMFNLGNQDIAKLGSVLAQLTVLAMKADQNQQAKAEYDNISAQQVREYREDREAEDGN